MDVNTLPVEVKNFIQDLLDENDGLRNRITELEDEIARTSKNKTQRWKRTNKKSWLDQDDDE